MTSTVTAALRWFTIATLLLAAYATAQPQTLRAAGITVVAEWLAEPDNTGPAIRIALDTHAGDLLAYDLAAAAALEHADGTRVPGTFTYDPVSDSSHHRHGLLRFVPASSADLTPPIELVLYDVGVPEWRFVWSAPDATPDPDAAAPATPAQIDASASSAERLTPSAMYVAVVADGAVAAIDPTTFDLVWTLVVSQGTDARPPEVAMGLALGPDGRTLYTGDVATGELVLIDTELREVVARSPLAHGIHAIDLAPDGRTLWVDGALEGYPWLSTTSVIDTASLEVIQRLAPALGSAAHLSFTPDGREVWAPSISTNLAWMWDASTGAVLDAVPLTNTSLTGDSPEAEQGLIGFNEISFAPDGRTAYAVGPEASVVYAVDVASRAVTGTAQVGPRAHGIAVRPDGREVWTANRGGSVTILDASTLAELATLDLGAYANHVAFTSDGAHALVSRRTDVAVIDVAERTIVRVVEVGREPHEFAVVPPLDATTAARER